MGEKVWEFYRVDSFLCQVKMSSLFICLFSYSFLRKVVSHSMTNLKIMTYLLRLGSH